MAKLDPVKMKDWQIAEAAEENLRTAKDLAAELGLLETEWEPYGRYLAKIDVTKVLARLGERKRAKYIDVQSPSRRRPDPPPPSHGIPCRCR